MRSSNEQTEKNDNKEYRNEPPLSLREEKTGVFTEHVQVLF